MNTMMKRKTSVKKKTKPALKQKKTANKTSRRTHTKKKKIERDIEKAYPTAQFVAKIRRLADALESGKQFSIQVANQRVYIPASAVINIEHEASGESEEIEFQLVWKRK